MKKTLLLLISLFIIGKAFADPVVKATAKSAVAVGDRFQVEYTINDKATDIRADFNIPGLDLVYGPATGTSISIINGVQSMTSSFTYTLIAQKEGTYTIPAATIVSGGNSYKSNSITIKVLPADQSSGSSPSSSSRNQEKKAQVNPDDVHLELSLSKNSAYIGEAIVATLKVYFRNTPIHSFSNAKLPDFDGFTAQQKDLNEQEATLERYNGANYQMYPLAQWILFPTRTGEIKIPSATIDAIAQVITHRSTGGWFDFPMDYAANVEIPLKSAEKKVTVKSLPSGKPASYSNGVGEFNISTELTSKSVKANDAIIYRITIEGTGNLKYVEAPTPNFHTDFDVYDPKEDLKAKTTAQGLSGSKVVEYTIIPRHAGTFEIPSLEFSYFDVKSGQYKTINTESYSLEVEKGVGDNSGSSNNVSNYAGAAQERLKVLGNDIRYIHILNSEDLDDDDTEIYGSYIYWLFYIVPILILAILAIVYRREVRLNSNKDLLRRRKASKVAIKRLKESAAALKAKNQNDFYEALHKALFGYASDKLNIKISELTTDSIAESLEQKSVPEDLIKEYLDIISTCEFARYAPSGDSQAMDQIYARATECIDNLEDNIKK
ncbi:MAG: protein BatD [Bacteroidales bacterium]|nr:protein BatD [Bacteroidales bacterium]